MTTRRDIRNVVPRRRYRVFLIANWGLSPIGIRDKVAGCVTVLPDSPLETPRAIFIPRKNIAVTARNHFRRFSFREAISRLGSDRINFG